MRNTFVRKMTELVRLDPGVMLLTGDLGFGTFEKFAAEFPENFINTGIAEQNMAGVAAGLALDGHRVFIYSIGNFPTLRCLEQWRNDICYHNLPVTVVVNGGGMAYGSLGMSHHATEDLSILRTLPGMQVMAPADPSELEKCFDFICRQSAPGYLRLCRGGEKILHAGLADFTDPVLVPLCMDEIADTAVIMCGEIASLFADIAAALQSRDIHADIYSSPFVKPLPDLTGVLSRKYKLCVTVEENSCIGGFGSGIAEYFSGLAVHPLLLRIALPDRYCQVAGKHEFLRDAAGLSAEKIVVKIVEKRMLL